MTVFLIGAGLGAVFNLVFFWVPSSVSSLRNWPDVRIQEDNLFYLAGFYVLLFGPSLLGAVLGITIGLQKRSAATIAKGFLFVLFVGIPVSILIFLGLISIVQSILAKVPVTWSLGYRISLWFLWLVGGFITGSGIALMVQTLVKKRIFFKRAFTVGGVIGVIVLGLVFLFILPSLYEEEPEGFSLFMFTALQWGTSLTAATYAWWSSKREELRKV